MSLEESLLLYFLGVFEKDWYSSFFECLIEFTSDAIWSWTFFGGVVGRGKFLITSFIFLVLIVHLDFLFHHDSILVGFVFLGIVYFI